ncbi:2-hydroxyacid dehydrogenase [Bdellovibrio sp. HCB288]|uniref:2-hydroxyacid dehydrogenase n=1 Tax=Bdellovibrio sp. HCB288 TaxID=3394355 RepID=UPI0039B3EA1C
MKVGFFSSKKYEEEIFSSVFSKSGFVPDFLEVRLTPKTVQLSKGYDTICCFVNDILNEDVLMKLKEQGVRNIALRCAGFNNVNISVANKLGMRVVRVPEYSPHAVAEHAVALLLTLNRKTHRAHGRIRDLNFSLEGLVGFDLYGKTVGVIGTGKIGRAFAQIMNGFGCKVLAYDPFPNPDMEKLGKYVSLQDLLKESDVISLHCPLNDQTRHMLSSSAFEMMKKNAVIINTGRGALIDTKELIEALKSHRIAGACLDVYEEEEGVFFTDQSAEGITDDVLARLTTFPNVILTSHQAFLTHEALVNIAETTRDNIKSLMRNESCNNEVK